MEIIIIVGMGENREIGYKGTIPWYLPRDLKFFKESTMGHTLIMGRKTMESIPNMPLKGRTNIIISKTLKKKSINDDIFIARTISESINIAKKLSSQKVFIIGGESIYKEFIPLADKMIITQVHNSFNNIDTFFPEWDKSKWIEKNRVSYLKDENNKYDITIIEYNKI